jgi:ABC-type nitrate/sulfonate/bicarbonate transport system substrate-binding protein
MSMTQTRRRFLTGVSLAGAAGFVGAPRVLAAEAALETTTVRLMRIPAICHAPQFVAKELLHAEGFTEVRFVDARSSAAINEAIAHGKIDFNLHFASQWVSMIDGGGPVTVLAGVHVGCFELFANEVVRSITDLKGRTVGVSGLGGERAPVRVGHGGKCRTGPDNRHSLGCERVPYTGRALRRRKNRRRARVPAGDAGAACAPCRSRDRQ